MSKSSSSSRHRNRKMAAILAAVYLFGVLFGCFLIWLIPVVKNRTDLLEIAADKGREILSAGQMNKVTIYGMEHWCYNEQGRLVSSERSFLYSGQYETIRGYVPAVLEQGEYFRPALLLIDNREAEPTYVFGVIAGVVVEGPNGSPFASILVRDFSDLDTTMFTYVALFTFMFLVAAIFIIYIFNKQRDLNRMRRDLIANVSHELKTPITAIRARAEALHDGIIKDNETRHLYSGKIIEESDRLEQLVMDILELSKLQSSHTQFKKVRVYADGVIPPVIDRYMMLCGDLGVHLDVSGLDLESVPALYTDPEKLVTLMSILLDNAVKFTGKDGSIWITQQLSPRHITFCIRDNGPGIRSEDVDRIFERFYKADVAHNSSGSGLGLAIADEIARGLGEKLWVESTYGAGTAFYFTVALKAGG